MVRDFAEELILVPFSVDLCIHALGDDIRKVVVSGTISEFHNLFSSVE